MMSNSIVGNVGGQRLTAVIKSNSITATPQGNAVLATPESGRIVMNDYLLEVTEIDNGYRLTITRGAEVQTLDITSGSVADKELPSVTDNDNGKILQVVNGIWSAVHLPKYEGEYEIVPMTNAEQVLATAQKLLDADIKVQKVPYFEVSNNSGGTTASIGSEVE